MWGSTLGLLALYVLTLPTTLPDFDAGEFAVLAVDGGVAHPPGYPLYVALLQLFAHLDGALGTVTALTLPSALAAVAGLALVQHALCTRGVPAWVAAVATAVVGTSPPVWRAATSLEPFGVHLALVGAAVWLTVRTWTSPSWPWAAASGALLGLGLCHHHTLVLVAPTLLWAVLGPSLARADAPATLRRAGAWLFGALAGSAPLALLPWQAAHGQLVWGDWSQPTTALLRHVLRTAYGTTSLAGAASQPWWVGPMRFGQDLVMGMSVAWLVPLVWGAVLLLRSRQHAPERALLAAFVLAGPAVALLFHTGLSPVEHALVARFFAMPVLLAAVPLATGLQALAQRLPLVRRLAGPVLLVHAAAAGAVSERRSETYYEQHIRDLFAALDGEAMVITRSDADTWGMLYGARVLRLGPKVHVLAGGLSRQPWHLAQRAAALGLPPDVQPQDMVEHAVGRMRVVALGVGAEWLAPLLNNAYVLGPWLVLLPPHATPPGVAVLLPRHQALVGRLHLPGLQQRQVLTPWEARLMGPLADNWDALANALARAGNPDGAAYAQAEAAALRPPAAQEAPTRR